MPYARLLAFAVLVTGSVAHPPTAHAGNDDDVLIGSEASLTGGAVTATVSTGASLVYDPAGLATLDTDTIDGSATVVALRHYRADRLLAATNGASDDARVTEFVTVPSQLAFVRTVAPRVRLGLGAFVPRSYDLVLRSDLATSDAMRNGQWVVGVSSTIRQYDAMVGVGVRAHRRFQIGAALDITYGSRRASTQIFAESTPTGQSAPDIFGSFNSLITQSFIGVRGVVGVQWQPYDRVRIGASVTTAGTTIAALRDQSSTGIYALTLLFVDDVPPVVDRSLRTVAEPYSPWRFRAGVALTMPRGSLAIDGDVQTALAANPYALVESRHAVWNARIGGVYRPSEHVTLGAGVFTDRSPSRRPSSFGESRIHYYGGTFGLSLEKHRALAESEPEDELIFTTTIALRYALGVGTMGQLLVVPSGVPNSADTTNVPARVHELALMVSSGVRF